MALPLGVDVGKLAVAQLFAILCVELGHRLHLLPHPGTLARATAAPACAGNDREMTNRAPGRFRTHAKTIESHSPGRCYSQKMDSTETAGADRTDQEVAEPTATTDPPEPTATTDTPEPTATTDPPEPTATIDTPEPTATTDTMQPTP